MSPVRPVATGFALLLGAYVAAYVALLDPARGGVGNSEACVRYRVPDYGAGGEVAHTAFTPLNWLDRQVRPGFWAKYEYYVDDAFDAEVFKATYGPVND